MALENRTWGRVGSLGSLLLALFLVADALFVLVGVFSPGHAVSVGDLVAIIEFLAGVMIFVGR